jgi:multiple sugar transport system permease protein
MRVDRLLTGLGKGLAVGLILIWSLFPIAFVVLSSLKPGRDIFAVPPKILFEPTLQHYGSLVTKWGGFFSGLLNSTVITAAATALAVTVSLMAGFIYSRHRGPLMTASIAFLIVVRLIPPIVVTLPLFPIMNRLGLNDTHGALIVLYATFFVSLGTMIMKTFIDQIPKELDEAAVVDGANYFDIYWRILLPLCRPILITVFALSFVAHWNDFFGPLIYLSTTEKYTLPLGLNLFKGMNATAWNLLLAASVMTTLPCIALYFVAQRYFIQGIVFTGVKE